MEPNEEIVQENPVEGEAADPVVPVVVEPSQSDLEFQQAVIEELGHVIEMQTLNAAVGLLQVGVLVGCLVVLLINRWGWGRG